jgi:deoxyribodipyrimidine photo-lyase
MTFDYNRSLVIFRRDLRWEDNTALCAAFQRSRSVVPCFIFTDEQTAAHPFRSINGFAFMLESLRELSDVIAHKGGHLYLFHGQPHDVVRAAIRSGEIDAVFVNKDYTPYSRKRDKAIAETCEAAGVPFHSFSDALLVEPSTFGKQDGSPYTVLRRSCS